MIIGKNKMVSSYKNKGAIMAKEKKAKKSTKKIADVKPVEVEVIVEAVEIPVVEEKVVVDAPIEPDIFCQCCRKKTKTAFVCPHCGFSGCRECVKKSLCPTCNNSI